MNSFDSTLVIDCEDTRMGVRFMQVADGSLSIRAAVPEQGVQLAEMIVPAEDAVALRDWLEGMFGA